MTPIAENYYYIRLYMDQGSPSDEPLLLCFSTLDPVFDNDESGDFDELDPENEPIYLCDGYNSFADFTFNGERKSIKIYLGNWIFDNLGSPGTTTQPKVLAEIGSLSKALYKYKRSVRLQGYNDDNPFAEPVPIYNNIEGGLGIFGGTSYQWYEVELDVD